MKDGLPVAALRGSLHTQEPMSQHTTWRVGGPADHYYKPADMEDLGLFMASLDKTEPLLMSLTVLTLVIGPNSY